MNIHVKLYLVVATILLLSGCVADDEHIKSDFGVLFLDANGDEDIFDQTITAGVNDTVYYQMYGPSGGVTPQEVEDAGAYVQWATDSDNPLTLMQIANDFVVIRGDTPGTSFIEVRIYQNGILDLDYLGITINP